MSDDEDAAQSPSPERESVTDTDGYNVPLQQQLDYLPYDTQFEIKPDNLTFLKVRQHCWRRPVHPRTPQVKKFILTTGLFLQTIELLRIEN